MSVIYEKGAVKLTDDGIVLKNYYFPTCRSKFVKYSEINKIERIECSIGNCKTWGMPFNGSWWHFDGCIRTLGRPGLLLHTDAQLQLMGISPAGIDEVEAIIRKHIKQ